MTTSSCPPPEGGTSIARTASLGGLGMLASLFLAACGGGGSSPPPPPPPPPPPAMTEVPASAAANDAALEAFAFNLPKTENTEPLGLDLVPTFPSSETEDPIPTP